MNIGRLYTGHSSSHQETVFLLQKLVTAIYVPIKVSVYHFLQVCQSFQYKQERFITLLSLYYT